MTTQTLNYDDNQSFPAEDDISHEEMAEAGLKSFFSITDEWALSNEQAQILLGSPGRTRFYDMRRGKSSVLRGLTNDELDRLAYITNIYAALNILYEPSTHTEWLNNNSQLPLETLYRPWGMGSPLSYMMTGKLKALSDVYDFVNTERGGV